MAESYSITHPGRVRLNNEDSYYADDENAMWIVCDGMGGHQEGNFASRLVTDIFEKMPLKGSFDSKIKNIESQFYNIYLLLKKRVHQLGDEAIIGTTVVLLLAEEQKGVCMYAGDSRCYLLREGKLSLVTIDHATMIETPSGLRKVLTNALAAPNGYEIEIKKFKIEKGDIFMLCSDGLYETLTSEQIIQTMNSSSLQEGLDKTVSTVLQNGGSDNLTAILVQI